MFTTLMAHYGHGGGHGPGPWIPLILLFWVGVVAFVVWRFRRGCPPWARNGGQSVLAERYARGEITADEYRERREVLKEEAR